MARPTTAPPTKKSAISTRKPGRPTATPANTPAKRPKVPAAAKPTRTAASPAAPQLGKDELRARVEALERAHATLRAKNRDANRAANQDRRGADCRTGRPGGATGEARGRGPTEAKAVCSIPAE